MAIFRIIRIYEIPATSRIEATDRMLEALELHTEEDYHVTDLVQEHGAHPAKSPVNLRSLLESEPRSRTPAKWGTIFKRQVTGKW
jgi:hypothetical protein